MLPASNPSFDPLISFVVGDTWGGIPSLSWTVGGSPPSPDVSTCEFIIKQQSLNQVPLVHLTQSDGITIISANNWTFAIPPRKLPELTAGTYAWKFRTVDVNGLELTLAIGQIVATPPN